jgi:hypothetical protein
MILFKSLEIRAAQYFKFLNSSQTTKAQFFQHAIKLNLTNYLYFFTNYFYWEKLSIKKRKWLNMQQIKIDNPFCHFISNNCKNIMGILCFAHAIITG